MHRKHKKEQLLKNPPREIQIEAVSLGLWNTKQYYKYWEFQRDHLSKGFSLLNLEGFTLRPDNCCFFVFFGGGAVCVGFGLFCFAFVFLWESCPICGRYFSSILELYSLDASCNSSPSSLQTLLNVPLGHTQSPLGEKQWPKTKLSDLNRSRGEALEKDGTRSH